MSRRKILVVDDEPGMLRAVQRVLERQYDLLCTSSAEEALARVVDDPPDLAVLDIRMPGMDGFELATRLKQLHPGLDLIFMTGSVSESDRKLIRAIRQEAFYFIQKPFDREVLQTLVERCLELRSLAENNRSQMKRLEGVLAEAHSFQASLFPRPRMEAEGVCVQALRNSCDELCGDFYDYAAVEEGRIAFLIADVSGHGAPAAMLTGVVKSAFQSCQRKEMSPLDVVDRIATGLRTFRANRFVTLFCGLVDTKTGTLEYVNAGHPPGLLFEGQDVKRLNPTGPLISPVFGTGRWKQERIPFGPGRRLWLCTDGITEAASGSEDYGVDRLIDSIACLSTKETSPVRTVMQGVLDYLKGRPPADDLTLLTIQEG